MNFFSEFTNTAWNFVPILLILFLFAGILFVFYLRNKIDECSIYLRSIALSLEKMSNRIDPDVESLKHRQDHSDYAR